MKELNFFEKLIGSGFYTGFIPFASGTFGSLAALIIYYIPGFEKPEIIIPVTIFFIIYGIFVGSKFEKFYGKDPSECTIDEIVGTWISLLFLPKIWWLSLVVFLLWRASDIIKPFPARKLESLNGGLGIMIDDIISSIYVLLIVQLYINLIG
ncbi:MAG TPA: phosphatidylglycerophosphatase A [Ignavibacteriaceae bacterium]|nr:phosphatidylglycerophosphatase A [Ignavibacteriaceae bacterium]